MMSQFSDIILCDDHHISLLGIEATLKKKIGPHLTVRHSHSGEEAIDLFHSKLPDLMIVDLSLPKMSGLDVVKSIRSEAPDCKLIVLSGSDDPYLFQQVIQQKVNAVLKKHNSVQNLEDALESVVKAPHETYLDPLIDSLIKKSIEIPLTNREYQVIELMAQGLTSQEIADKLECSLPTIKTYRMRIMNKSGARNSSEILAWFLTKGNIKRDSSSKT